MIYSYLLISKWPAGPGKDILEEEKPTQTILRLVFGLNHVMLLRRHQGLVLDHCKNEHRQKHRNTQKCLDHCQNEHKEEIALGLHGARD